MGSHAMREPGGLRGSPEITIFDPKLCGRNHSFPAVPSASSRLNMREVQLLRQKHGPLAFSGTCVQQSQTSLAFCKLTVKKLLRKHIRRHES